MPLVPFTMSTRARSRLCFRSTWLDEGIPTPPPDSANEDEKATYSKPYTTEGTPKQPITPKKRIRAPLKQQVTPKKRAKFRHPKKLSDALPTPLSSIAILPDNDFFRDDPPSEFEEAEKKFQDGRLKGQNVGKLARLILFDIPEHNNNFNGELSQGPFVNMCPNSLYTFVNGNLLHPSQNGSRGRSYQRKRKYAESGFGPVDMENAKRLTEVAGLSVEDVEACLVLQEMGMRTRWDYFDGESISLN
ncbi:hypothetical protein EJ08DRAFT_679761 [Tothia fuscella]|uniref:Uncharacterized protein n=1 Tax=Tothia fuscella TaxID=1048955 RepID=A0A9P4TY73_9PEZI|nr:hypothetical protein EJ08DRAFT_679761 [Tothia fuscella]